MRLINLLSWLPGHSGFGSYVQRVLPAIDGWRMQLDATGHLQLIPAENWLPNAPPWAPKRHIRFLQRYSLVQHAFNISEVLTKSRIFCNDIESIYSPFFDSILSLPTVPQLITCHDLTPLVSPNSKKAWLRYRFWQPRHCRAATRLIAISHYVADQLVNFGVDSRSIVVIPNGISIERPRVISSVSQDLLALARHDVNKNLPALLRGVYQLQTLYPQWEGVLRIVGRPGRQTRLVTRLCAELPRPNQVQLIDSISHLDLLTYLRSSLALISSSSEEGFDYPILESKAEGIPTVVSDISVHREFHDGTSLFFPGDDNGIHFANHIISLIRDTSLWSMLSQDGFSLAKRLSISCQQSAIRRQLDDLSA